jgi:ABC-2 type transport system ATP-binding protein
MTTVVGAVVQASALRVVRTGTEILRGLEFAVPPGRVTGLLGPSGCGKTTLLRTIAGVQRHAGTLTVLGHAAGSAVLRDQIGYAAQTGAVYRDLTVRENLRYFAEVLRAPRSDVSRVLQVVDLGDHADRLVERLSGGERSRVNLAVALLGAPQLLLLDEPTVGLDPVLREQLWQTFGRLAADGMTLLVSSHVMDEAERCDELLLMRDGRLLAQESPTALRRRTGEPDLERAFLALIRRQSS